MSEKTLICSPLKSIEIKMSHGFWTAVNIGMKDHIMSLNLFIDHIHRKPFTHLKHLLTHLYKAQRHTPVATYR